MSGTVFKLSNSFLTHQEDIEKNFQNLGSEGPPASLWLKTSTNKFFNKSKATLCGNRIKDNNSKLTEVCLTEINSLPLGEQGFRRNGL